jgi:hypothetical protein
MFGFLDGGTPHYVGAGKPASGSSGAAIGTAGIFGNGTPHYLGAGQPGSDGSTRGIFGFLSSWLAGMRPVYLRAPSSSGQVEGQETHAATVDAGQPAPTATQSMQPGPTATSVA